MNAEHQPFPNPNVPSVNRLDRFFEVTARGSSLGAEVRGGVVSFIAMAYIIVLNPIILGISSFVGV